MTDLPCRKAWSHWPRRLNWLNPSNRCSRLAASYPAIRLTEASGATTRAADRFAGCSCARCPRRRPPSRPPHPPCSCIQRLHVYCASDNLYPLGPPVRDRRQAFAPPSAADCPASHSPALKPPCQEEPQLAPPASRTSRRSGHPQHHRRRRRCSCCGTAGEVTAPSVPPGSCWPSCCGGHAYYLW